MVVRRFLLHVFPSSYVRIRHFGLLANRNRKDNIASCREFLGTGKTVRKENDRQETWQEQLLRICGIDVTTCPACKKAECQGWRIYSPIDATAHRRYSDGYPSQYKNHISCFLRKEHPIVSTGQEGSHIHRIKLVHGIH